MMSVVFGISKLWSECTNTLTVHNKKTLYKAIAGRPPNKSLVTVANHHSCIDDPIIWCVLKWRYLVRKNVEVMRWTLAASDVCFTKEWHSRGFSLGRVVPIVRGAGVYQRSMDFMLDKLNHGDWVHTFPEGKINAEKEFIRLKWGVGRLIADCVHTPLVLPIWHVGIDDILPNSKPYIPRTGKNVTMLVGNPMDFSDMLQNLRDSKSSPKEIRKRITDAIQDELRELQHQAENLHCLSNTETVKS